MIIKKKKGYNYDPNTWNGKILIDPRFTKRKILGNKYPNIWNYKFLANKNLVKKKIEEILKS